MTKNQNLVYSSGKLITLWQLIYFASQYSDVSMQELSSMFEESGTLGGSVPFDDAVRLGKYCEFLEFGDGKLILGDVCYEMLLPLCSTKDPNTFVIRFILQRIIILSLYGFPWLLFFDKDIETFKASIPQEWVDLLDQANLFDFFDKDVEEWWDVILIGLNNFDLSNTKEIGDVGEKLTIDHETDRLFLDGVLPTQHYVKWVSRFSDNYGYDVLSARGKKLKARKSLVGVIQVEVKATVSTNINSFRFKISRNEWNIALKNLDSYYFYCWLGVNVYLRNATSGPFVIPAKKFLNIIPKDQSDLCEWTECRLIIDLLNFSL